jgi:hypothetical protein
MACEPGQMHELPDFATSSSQPAFQQWHNRLEHRQRLRCRQLGLLNNSITVRLVPIHHDVICFDIRMHNAFLMYCRNTSERVP